MKHHTNINIEASRLEYKSLPENEWRKDYFDEATGGYVATHVLKERDDLRRSGIAAEVKACFKLATMGEHILRLPENVPNFIDNIIIEGKPYRELLKFKANAKDPRGYPDAYFNGQTWDFKVSKSKKEDTLRQLIKEGRKADNIIFITNDERTIKRIQHALERHILLY